MITRSFWLCSLVVAVLFFGAARPAHATKQYNFSMGASCQAANLVGVIPPLTYANGGVMVDGVVPADLICPITWSKQLGSTWQTLTTLDIQIDWLNLPSGTTGTTGPSWGCSLYYQTPGGTLVMQSLPVTNPIPSGSSLVNMTYAALLCTVPASMGIAGYTTTMCFVNPNNPGGC